MINARLQNVAFTFLIITSILLLMIFAQELLVPIMAAGFLSMLLTPLIMWFEKLRLPRILAIFLALLVCIVLLVGIGFFFASQISNIAGDLSGIEQRFNQISAEVGAVLNNTFGIKDNLNFGNLSQELLTFVKSHAGKIFGVAFTTLGRLALLLLIPVYIVMFLLYRDHFTKFIIRLFSDRPANEVKDIVVDLRLVIQHYIVGILKVMVILATLNAAGLLILGIKHAIFFAIFAALLNVIPYIGPLIGSIIPITFALFTKDSLWYPVGVLIVFSVNQFFEGHFWTPTIVGSKVSINPLTSLLALIIGGTIWGIVGMILFIPLTAIVKKLLELSPRTEVYAYLMGEENPEKKSNSNHFVSISKKLKDRFK